MDSQLDIRLDPLSSEPPSRQLVGRVLDLVARGALTSGAQLPSVRGLAASALVNHNTVARAYRDLEVLGVVRGENGRGVFVTERGPQLARAQHGGAMLQRFEDAARAALDSGHEVAALQSALHTLASRGERKAS